MVEGVTTGAHQAFSAVTKTDLIKEVFIEPIRNVIVIDDEFPSLDQLLDTNKNDQQDDWKDADIARVRDILKFARSKDRPWLVDVHDPRRIKPSSERNIAPHLDHSDLMVLDYHLEGEAMGGRASLDILRRLALNGHHNLVIVYTGGYENDIERVCSEIALGLIHKDDELASPNHHIAEISAAIEEWEDENPKVFEELVAQVPEAVYFQVRSEFGTNYGKFLSMPESNYLKTLIRGRKINVGNLVKWLFLQRQNDLAPRLCEASVGEIVRGTTGAAQWLRTDRLFAIVVSKKNQPGEFESILTEALLDSYPSPHNLLLARMRTCIDEEGAQAQNAVLADRDVQAAWLSDFLATNPADEGSAVMSAVQRHWDALGDHIRENLVDFSKKVRSAFKEAAQDEVFERCGLSQKDLELPSTILNYNRFISTKRFDRGHLTTGHAFRIDDSYWICLSPACDLVPGQKTSGWNKRLGNAIPFIAFRLWKIDGETATKIASTNNFVFLKNDGVTEAYSIYPEGMLGGRNPEWEQMFADDLGRFHENSRLGVFVTSEEDGRLSTSVRQAVVVAQLRPEYALNLLQRVGAFLFRPGLGMHFKNRVVPATN